MPSIKHLTQVHIYSYSFVPFLAMTDSHIFSPNWARKAKVPRMGKLSALGLLCTGFQRQQVQEQAKFCLGLAIGLLQFSSKP